MVLRIPKIMKLFLSFLMTAALVLLSAFPGVSFAAGGLTLSTTYPGIMVKAGENVNFSLEIANNSGAGQNVALSVESIPDGWKGYFEGSGKLVGRAYVNPDKPANVDFNVQVPADAAEGNYQIALKADAGSGIADLLNLELEVGAVEFVQGKFTSQYPELQGPGSAAFKYSVDLVNNSGEDQSYSLSAKAPDGWQVTFSPSYDAKQIASLSVKPGESQGLNVDIVPAQNVTAGKYTVTCSAVSATETLTTDLTVLITGTYNMELSTPTGLLSLDAHAGRETPVTLTIQNKGSAELKNVTLSSSAPANWAVRFAQPTIDTIAAGASQEVIAYVKPGTSAIAGDYAISISASTNETKSQADFRVAVKTPTIWGVVGIVIILALAYGLVRVFRKYGRR